MTRHTSKELDGIVERMRRADSPSIPMPVAHDKRHLVDEKYSLRGKGKGSYTQLDEIFGVDWGQEY